MLQAKSEIPEFNNVDEESAWWDQHFAEEWLRAEPIGDSLELAPPRLTVQISWPVKQALTLEARRRKVSVSQLVREWLEERLDLPISPG